MARRKLSELFFKVENEPEEKAQSTISVAAPVTQVSAAYSASPIGKEDAEIKKQLLDALEQANLEGYDYFEFAKAVDAQAALIPAEALRFQAAHAAASVIGVTVEKLTSTAQHYLDILASKESEFNKALEQHTSSAVTSKEQSMKDLDAQMQVKAAEIQKMTEEINDMQKKKTALSNEISTAKADIERVRNNFTATLQVFTSKIKSDIEKVKTYLGGNK